MEDTGGFDQQQQQQQCHLDSCIPLWNLWF